MKLEGAPMTVDLLLILLLQTENNLTRHNTPLGSLDALFGRHRNYTVNH